MATKLHLYLARMRKTRRQPPVVRWWLRKRKPAQAGHALPQLLLALLILAHLCIVRLS